MHGKTIKGKMSGMVFMANIFLYLILTLHPLNSYNRYGIRQVLKINLPTIPIGCRIQQII